MTVLFNEKCMISSPDTGAIWNTWQNSKDMGPNISKQQLSDPTVFSLFWFCHVKKLKEVKVHDERKCYVAWKKDGLDYAPWVNSADRAI